MSTTRPTPKVASSSRRRPQTPRIPVNTNPNPGGGESGEEELTQSYQEADTARADITPLLHDPSILETLRSSIPTHVSSSTNNREGPLEEPPEEIEGEEIPVPPKPVKKTTRKTNKPKEVPASRGAQAIGKFIGAAILKVAEAGEIPIPPIPSPELAKFLQKEDPMITMTEVFKEIITEQTTYDSNSSQYSGFSQDLTRIWARKKEYKLLSWTETVSDYRDLSESEISNWPEQDIFYPLPISAYMESSDPESRNLFKRDAQDALRKWRSPGTSLPRIYPTKKDWKEGIAFSILERREDDPFQIWKPLSYNVLRGIGDAGQPVIRFFIIEHFVGEFREKLQTLRSKMDIPPFFPLPQFGVSEKLLKQGLTEDEARQAAAIFRVESEACLLEIWKKLCPTMSDKVFRTNTDSIYKLSMPFWAEDPTPAEERSDIPDYSHIRDTPPHLTFRRRRTPIHVPDNNATYDMGYDVHRNFVAHDSYTPARNIQQDSRSLRAALAARHVGTLPDISERSAQLGQGRLRDSIVGPHYVRDSPIEFTRTRNSARLAVKNEMPEIRLSDEPIFIDELPGSQDSQQGDEGPPTHY